MRYVTAGNVTGDIAAIDQDGFIRIRIASRASARSPGEMVPHMRIEEEIQRLLAEPHVCIVTSVPDDSKGERLVAFYTDPDVTPQQVWERLSTTSMPKLWCPSAKICGSSTRSRRSAPAKWTCDRSARVRRCHQPAARSSTRCHAGARSDFSSTSTTRPAAATYSNRFASAVSILITVMRDRRGTDNTTPITTKLMMRITAHGCQPRITAQTGWPACRREGSDVVAHVVHQHGAHRIASRPPVATANAEKIAACPACCGMN